MKITVTVDLDDIVLECDEFNEVVLNDAIKEEIKKSIRREAIGTLSKDSLTEISRQIKEEIKDISPSIVSATIADVINTRAIRPVNYREEKITIKQYIEDSIDSKYAQGSDIDKIIQKHVVDRAAEVSNELKTRYDGLFAMQIVNNLKQMNMLKDNIGDMLLANNPQH